ncbi:MAG: FAD-dependent monooxygenase [Xanthomonadales bacterium]|nr:FAD-dependent monooxygenase [Xanthomonadales bacterium]
MARSGMLDVAVVGAGPAGLAAALRLQALGMKVAIIADQWPRPWSAQEYDLRVVALAPDAQRLLDGLGVWRAVLEARAQPVLGMRIDEASAPTTLGFDAAASGLPALAWIIELGLLADRLAKAWISAGGELHEGVAVDSLTLSTDSAVLNLNSGERVRARLIVAADGAASPLRTASGISVDQRDYEQRALVCAVSTARAHQQIASQRFLSSGPLAFLPLSDGRSSIVWSTSSDHAQHLLDLSDGDFCAALSAVAGDLVGEILSCGPRAAFPLRLQLARQYCGERLVLLGDAAHQVHPLAGQGLNLGLRDVDKLAEVAAWASRGGLDPGLPGVLGRYQRAQRSDSWVAAHAFDGLERWFSISEGPLAQLRRSGFRWVANSAMARHWLTRMATR